MLFDTSALLLLHLHHSYINIFSGHHHPYKRKRKPELQNRKSKWLDGKNQHKLTKRTAAARRGVDHQPPQPLARTHARSPFRIHTSFLARNKVIIFLFLMLSSTPMHTTHIIVLSLPGDCQMTGFHRCIALLRLYLLVTRDLLRTLSSTVVLGVYETEVQLTKERQQQ
jgi:hypothetical protein